MTANAAFEPSLPLTPSAPSALSAAIGIDIGGTKICSAMVTSQFAERPELSHVQQAATPQNAELFLETLEDMIAALRRLHPDTALGGVGISTAGAVNNQTGAIVGSVGNLPFLAEIPNLKTILEARMGLPVRVENDANAAAYAEYRVGAGRGSQSVMMVTLGTGVGGGFVSQGAIYSGSRHFAMEVGHVCIDKDRRRQCTCGRWGCWEAFASGTGLRKTIHETLLNDERAQGSRLLALNKDVESVGNHDLMDAVALGDAAARLILDIWHHDIATGLGSVMNVLDPDVVVVGGGLCRFVDFEVLTQRTHRRCMVGGTPIRRAVLDNHAGVVGAAYLAMETVC